MYFNVFISPLNSSSDWGLASNPAYAPGPWSTHVHTCEQCVHTGPVNDSSRLCTCTILWTIHVHHPCAPFRCSHSGEHSMAGKQCGAASALQTWEFSSGLFAQLLFTSTHLKSLCCLLQRKNESQLSDSLACQRAVSARAWLCFYLKKDSGSESPTFTS